MNILRVVTTGASGFIGSMVPACLASQSVFLYAAQHQQRVLQLSMQTFSWALGRSIPSHVPLHDSVLLHLADAAHTFGLTDSERARRVEDCRMLFRQAVEAGARRIVLLSSCKAGYEHGVAGEADAPESALTAYGRGKRAQEQTLWEAVRGSATQAVVLRPALVYGPGVKGSLGAWLVRASVNRMPPLPRTQAQRSMVHVQDLARVIAAVAQSEVADGGTFYVTDLRAWRLAEMDAAIRAGLGRSPRRAVPAWTWKVAGALGSASMRCGVNIGVDLQRVAALTASACYDSEPLWQRLQMRPEHDFVQSVPAMLSAVPSAMKDC